MTSRVGSLHEESGSIAPLGIGLCLLSVATILGFGAAGSLYVHQQRLNTVAENVALAVASGSESAEVFLRRWPAQTELKGLIVVRAELVDGKTAEVRLCSEWVNPVQVLALPNLAKVCAEAKARAW